MKKLLLILILLTYILVGHCATYTPQYPTQDDDHVKATSSLGAGAEPWRNTDPTKSLTGVASDNCWQTETVTNQRFHIDLGSAKIVRRIYYENFHHGGADTNVGTQNFTFWGSNTEADFLELTYLVDGDWVDLTLLLAQTTFDIHVSADQVDPKYILVNNSTSYQYYAFKFADNWGHGGILGGRHIELQTEDVVGITWNGVVISKWNGVEITIPINTQ